MTDKIKKSLIKQTKKTKPQETTSIDYRKIGTIRLSPQIVGLQEHESVAPVKELKYFDKQLKKYDPFIQHRIDEETLRKAQTSQELLLAMRDILPFWVKVWRWYPVCAQTLLDYMRKRAMHFRPMLPGLRAVPDDFLSLLDWTIDLEHAIGEKKAASGGLTEDQVEILNYLAEEYPVIRHQQDIGAIFSSNKDRQTLRSMLNDMMDKNLVSRPPGKKKGYLITEQGKECHEEYFN